MLKKIKMIMFLLGNRGFSLKTLQIKQIKNVTNFCFLLIVSF